MKTIRRYNGENYIDVKEIKRFNGTDWVTVYTPVPKMLYNAWCIAYTTYGSVSFRDNDRTCEIDEWRNSNYKGEVHISVPIGAFVSFELEEYYENEWYSFSFSISGLGNTRSAYVYPNSETTIFGIASANEVVINFGDRNYYLTIKNIMVNNIPVAFDQSKCRITALDW